VLGVALNGLEHAHLALSQVGGGVEQQLDESSDGGDRGAQLVGDRGHHVVLHLGQLAQSVVLLNERLRDFLLDGVESLPVGGQLFALGHVDGDDDVAPLVGGSSSLWAIEPFERPAASWSTFSGSSSQSSSSAMSGVGTGSAGPHDAAAC